MSQEAKDALQKFTVEAIEKFKSRTAHETNFVSDFHEESQDMIASSSKEIEDEDTQPNHPDQDLETPRDDLLDFINCHHHTEDQLEQVLQTYQAYTGSRTPSRKVNAPTTYHFAQASQPKHESLVDRGANGGLAGSVVRVLSTYLSGNVLSLV